MRINHVKKARKAIGLCSKCHKEIEKGQAYDWIKGRYTSKRVKHASCPAFRPSEMTGSDKKSRLYGAQESIEDALNAPLSGKNQNRQLRDALVEAFEQAIAEAEEVAQEYHDAANADEKQGGIYQQNEETAGNVETWVEDLQSARDEIENHETAMPRDSFRNDVEAIVEDAIGSLQI